MSEPLAAHRLPAFALAFVLLAGFGGASQGWAQTPSSPPAESGQQPSQGQTQEAPPATTPTPATPPAVPPVTPEQLLQQYPLQSPIGPPISPASPPGTKMPPWTPPTPPAPSQTNIPAPLLGPGGPGGAPGFVGVPGLTIPGAFAPTITTVRGATLEFHPTLRLSEEYSDNFFLTSSHARHNFRSTFGPGFTVLLNGARTFGALSTAVDLVHDTVEHSGPDVKVFPSVNAAIRYALTPRLALTFTDTFVRSDSANTLDRSGLRQGRQTSSTNSAALTVDWLLDQVATQAYYRNVLFFNEGDAEGGAEGGAGQTNQGNQNNSITHILGVNAATRVATDYLIRAGYEFSRTDTMGGGSNNVGGDTTSHTFFGAASRQFGLYTTGGVSTSYSFQTQNDSRTWNASVFGAYGLPMGLSFSGAVGYSVLMSDSQDSEGMVSANATVSYRFTRAVISVGVFQDFRQTAQQGENFGTVQTRSYFGSFLYQLTPFINSLLRVTYTENSPTGTGNVEGSGTQKYLTYGAAVNWQALRWLTASLQYSYTQQTGNSAFNQGGTGNTGDTGNYAENRVTLSLFATF